MSFMLEARLLPVLTASWHRGRRYCPAQGRTLASSWEGFIAGARSCSSPSPGGPASPLRLVPLRVCLCMCVIWPICHNHRAQIKMQQLLGGIVWNGMNRGGGARVVLISREGGQLERHSTFLQTWTRDGEGSRGCVCVCVYVCVCVCVCVGWRDEEECRGWRPGGRRRPQPADHVGRRALWSQRRGECEGVNWDSEWPDHKHRYVHDRHFDLSREEKHRGALRS